MNKLLICLVGAGMFAGISVAASHAQTQSTTPQTRVQSSEQVFTGRISRNSNDRDPKDFILYDQNTHQNYYLDSNQVGRKYNDDVVQITGTVDRHDAIHAESVQPVR